MASIPLRENKVFTISFLTSSCLFVTAVSVRLKGDINQQKALKSSFPTSLDLDNMKDKGRSTYLEWFSPACTSGKRPASSARWGPTRAAAASERSCSGWCLESSQTLDYSRPPSNTKRNCKTPRENSRDCRVHPSSITDAPSLCSHLNTCNIYVEKCTKP